MGSDSRRPRINYSRLNSSRDEVRFLEIEPASSTDDQVVCRLVTLPLSRDIEYIAISSLLGDPADQDRIILDRTAIPVPVNIAQALRHVRTVFYPAVSQSAENLGKERRSPSWLRSLLRHFGARECNARPKLRVWIDCICLNAADSRENSKSRVIMYHVYQRAQMVVGWVGLKIPQTDLGVQLIQAFDNAIPDEWQEPGDREIHPENYAPYHEWAIPIIHLFDPQADAALGTADFLNRPFFHRRWILEEMAMARVPTFLIGDAIVSWKQLLKMNLAMEEFKDYESNVCPATTRPLIHEFPLGTIHALLDEFEKRSKMAKMESLNGTSVTGSVTSAESFSQQKNTFARLE
ncbi:putative heterokaryon incompatibility protein [Fusarium austroafricanum]|uniref:Putative heterokaryon incompatibility protein n=1 Tax=Fusarium austroafricanum TaxID=2364996 RepID=A0A8H4KX34_9HYPO|nr:putative heterokaryon incompatibility protein [Fusarium austroafricanum]